MEFNKISELRFGIRNMTQGFGEKREREKLQRRSLEFNPKKFEEKVESCGEAEFDQKIIETPSI